MGALPPRGQLGRGLSSFYREKWDTRGQRRLWPQPAGFREVLASAQDETWGLLCSVGRDPEDEAHPRRDHDGGSRCLRSSRSGHSHGAVGICSQHTVSVWLPGLTGARRVVVWGATARCAWCWDSPRETAGLQRGAPGLSKGRSPFHVLTPGPAHCPLQPGHHLGHRMPYGVSPVQVLGTLPGFREPHRRP